ncbi:MAG: DUF559 domain-containing protein [Solirubrobacteraceae bacterium]
MTTAQLRAVGWDSSLVHDRVLQARLHPVFAEVYSLGGPPRTDREWWMASVLTFGTGTKLSHSPAVELYGWLRYALRQLHVTTTTKRHPRDGIVPHHRERPVRWRYIDGIPVTSPEQTVLDCATTIRSDKAYRRIVRQAQVDEVTNHARLIAFAALSRGARGVARMKRELADGPSPTRSGFEDDVLDVFRRGGEPEVNADIGGDEVDLYFPALAVVIEVDGSPHANPTAKADDAVKQARLEARGLQVLRLS